jgi:O-antigen ligase
MSDLVHPGRKALDEWRAFQAVRRDATDRRADTWMALWATTLLVATLLYAMIGPTPYIHELVFDPLTGGAIISPINRYAWLGLLALSMPILIFRLNDIPRVGQRLWPLLVLFVWFIASTRWAIDPAASQRRLLVTVVGLTLCLAIKLGLPDGQRAHTAMAWTCAIIVGIDLGSWVLLPTLSMTTLGLAAIHNHKNTLGSVMLFCSLVIAPYCWSRPTLAGRLAWGSVFVACLVLLIASRSKTSIALAIVAAVLAAVTLTLLRMRAHLLRTIVAAAFVLAIATGFSWLVWCYVNGFDPLGPIQTLNFSRRTDVWRFVLEQSARHPIRGVGFGSFWDVDPAVQPSKQTDLWFAKPDAPTNEAHNGYLDLLVTVGLPGLTGALILLFGWILRGLSLIRQASLATQAAVRATLPFAIYLGLFPMIFFAHNWMESSYFTADSAYGLIIVLTGIYIDTATATRAIA